LQHVPPPPPPLPAAGGAALNGGSVGALEGGAPMRSSPHAPCGGGAMQPTAAHGLVVRGAAACGCTGLLSSRVADACVQAQKRSLLLSLQQQSPAPQVEMSTTAAARGSSAATRAASAAARRRRVRMRSRCGEEHARAMARQPRGARAIGAGGRAGGAAGVRSRGGREQAAARVQDGQLAVSACYDLYGQRRPFDNEGCPWYGFRTTADAVSTVLRRGEHGAARQSASAQKRTCQ
jgi:hypothetical protein